MWEREAEYREELELVIQKAATTRLERLATIAVEDERTCYKHVVVVLEKQYRKCGANMRGKLHLLYSVSALLRFSRKQQGPRDRYAERLKPLTGALVSDLRLDFAAQIDKLLKLWRMEGVFNVEQLADVESGRSAQALRPPGLQSKSPSGSLTEASAQDPYIGIGDASGSGRSSAIQSYTRFPGSRTHPITAGALPAYQQPPVLESQDPYSADSNPNGNRAPPPPPPPPLQPPPPPPLIPPGLLGPVGPPGLLPQTQAAAAAAAVAAAGLFPQNQLSGFLGAAPGALLQQAPFMPPMGPFGAGNMGAGLPGGMGGAIAMGGAMGPVMPGAMGPGMPFQGPPGPMPPGLGLQRPPMFNQQPMFGGQNQAPQSQGQRSGHYNRSGHAHGRTPPGLGPSPAIGPGSNQGPGTAQGWQGRYGPDAGLGPMPPGLVHKPAPPPGSPPPLHADSRPNSAANNSHKGSSGTESSTGLAAGIGGSGGGGAGTGSSNGGGAQAGSGTGPALSNRQGGRRSRWELERDSGDATAEPSAAAGVSRPAEEPRFKRPALGAEGGNAPLGAPQQPGSAGLPQPPPPPPPPHAPAPEPSPPCANGERGHGAEARAAEKAGLEQQEQHSRGPEGIGGPPPQLQQAKAELPTDKADAGSSATAGCNRQLETEHPLPSSAGMVAETFEGTAELATAGHPDETAAAQGSSEVLSAEPVAHQQAAASMEETAGGVAGSEPGRRHSETAAEAMDADDGGSSSAEAVCLAAQPQDSTAPSSPGRGAGAAPATASIGTAATAAVAGPVAEQESKSSAEADTEGSARAQDEQQRRQVQGAGAAELGCEAEGASAPVAEEATAQADLEAVSMQGAEPVTASAPAPVEEPEPQGLDGEDDLQAVQQPGPHAAVEIEVHVVEIVGAQAAGAGAGADKSQVGPPEEVANAVQAAGEEDHRGEPPGDQSAGRSGAQVVAHGDGNRAPSGAVSGQEAAVAACEPAGGGDGSAASVGDAEAAQSAVPGGVLEASAEQAPADSATSGDAQPAVSGAAVQASQAELDSAGATSSGMPQPAPAVVATTTAAAVAAVTAVPAAAATPLGCAESQQQQPARPPEQQQLSSINNSALHLSYDDSRVPLQLEELELGELDDTWL